MSIMEKVCRTQKTRRENVCLCISIGFRSGELLTMTMYMAFLLTEV